MLFSILFKRATAFLILSELIFRFFPKIAFVKSFLQGDSGKMYSERALTEDITESVYRAE